MTAIRTVIRIIIYGFTRRSGRRAHTVSWSCCKIDGDDVMGQEDMKAWRGAKHVFFY
jgi:hypothetical protein